MATQCLRTQGTTVTVQDDLLVHTAIGGVNSLSLNGAAADNLDRTDFASTAKEWCRALPDEGDVSLEMFVINDDAGQLILLDMEADGNAREFIITDEEGYTRTFNAYVNVITEEAATNNLWTMSVTLKVTGSIVKAAPLP